jgi:hypothetical protein
MIIFGTRQKGEVVGFVPSRCSFCGPTVLGVIQRTKKFTLYFVPVFTYGKDSTAVCAQCGNECYLSQGTKLYSTEYAALTALAAQHAPEPEPTAVPAGSTARPCKRPGCSNTTSAPDGLCWGCFRGPNSGWAD